MSAKSSLRVNQQIHAKEVRLIGVEGEQVGIVTTEDAIKQAEEAGMDLVEISPQAKPPVCRVMDYGKYLFQLSKKKAVAKKKQKSFQIKELKFRPGIEEGDYQVKLRKMQNFIEEGNKVKITIRFRGREVMHNELGFELLKRLEADLGEDVVIEQEAKFEGRQVVMVIAPQKK